MSGYIHIITGPMFSGKSSKLINIIKQYEPKDILVFNHVSDIRYSNNNVCTHDGTVYECYMINNLSFILNMKELNDAKYIFIDEFQFFNDTKDVILKLCNEYNKHVVIAGLSLDFKLNTFGDLYILFPFSNKIDVLYGKCFYCDERSVFTCKLYKNGNIHEVGSSEKYISTCRNHYLNV
jgi:thymidine kinase